jgi:hypothetical protein
LKLTKRQEKSLASKRDHPVLQNMKFLHCYLILWVIFALLDPDPGPQLCIPVQVQGGTGTGARLLLGRSSRKTPSKSLNRQKQQLTCRIGTPTTMAKTELLSGQYLP